MRNVNFTLTQSVDEECELHTYAISFMRNVNFTLTQSVFTLTQSIFVRNANFILTQSI